MADRRPDGAGPTADAADEEAAAVDQRFYGRRHGRRLRRLRSALVETLLPRLEIRLPEAGGAVVPADLFGRPVAAVWLEVGFGAGEHLVAQVRANRNVGFIGCEPFVNGVATLLADIGGDPPDNLRLFAEDARLLLPRLPNASLERVFLLFPDPWPKVRHHRRRFITADTVQQLARIIVPGGELRVATDHPGYARWTLDHLGRDAARSGAFVWAARRPEDWRRPPADWVITRYQRKAEAAGVAPMFLTFRRRSPADAAMSTRKDLVRSSGQDI